MSGKLLVFTLMFVAATFVEIKCNDDDDTDAGLEDWERHAERVLEEFKCGVPQPRSLFLYELDSRFPKHRRKYHYPPSTVLHRCDSAGCCRGGKICSYLKTEPVFLTFGIIEEENGKLKTFTIEQFNHTSCSCQKDQNGIK